jgi:hypothetical protein
VYVATNMPIETRSVLRKVEVSEGGDPEIWPSGTKSSSCSRSTPTTPPLLELGSVCRQCRPHLRASCIWVEQRSSLRPPGFGTRGEQSRGTWGAYVLWIASSLRSSQQRFHPNDKAVGGRVRLDAGRSLSCATCWSATRSTTSCGRSTPGSGCLTRGASS